MRRKVVSLFLAVMLIFLFPMNVFAAENQEAESRGVMPHTVNHSSYTELSCFPPAGTAGFILRGTVTYNLANDTVMYVENLQIRQTTYAVNLKSWTVERLTYSTNGANVNVTAIINLIFEYQDPYTGNVQTYHDRWTQTFTWTY